MVDPAVGEFAVMVPQLVVTLFLVANWNPMVHLTACEFPGGGFPSLLIHLLEVADGTCGLT